MTAKDIFFKISVALKENRPVYYTDGTVTRSIKEVVLNAEDPLFRKTLDILVDDSGGWRSFPIGIGWELEYPYTLTECMGELYLAPEWWAAL